MGIEPHIAQVKTEDSTVELQALARLLGIEPRLTD
jgi:hypothetical protein